jgi:DNA-binding transcriptional MocR family regulator
MYDAIRQMVLTGALRPGDRLPASRELAEMLDVSRVTVSLTYDQLTAEGYLHARRGSGTFVSSQIPDALGETYHRSLPRTVPQARIRLSKYAGRVLEEPGRRQVPAGGIDLSCFAPDYEGFPMAEWRERSVVGFAAAENSCFSTRATPADTSLCARLSRRMWRSHARSSARRPRCSSSAVRNRRWTCARAS